MTVVKPIHARDGEIVDIHWHVDAGIYIERRRCPPKSTREAKPDAAISSSRETGPTPPPVRQGETR